ncbi:hypothetical protein T440DRAFT_468999 [Plenodomus tracheiphilus IPT5]|uniref:Uncharacterized protein n=1 Tax=Plenodomus tracheiphilus IPT5 TaxID=1408161 RepID=A0A6A7B384_9PLEO|nr:hypothetical protein T440DRAFT_468999 [Plenodomus tracheiphilus IPT5]
MHESLPLPIHVISVIPQPFPRGVEMLRVLRHLPRMLKTCAKLSTHILVRMATLPYYRLYSFNTIAPLERIAKLQSESRSDSRTIRRAISSWRTRKLSELQFITIACTVLAAAVIGAFSWTTVEEAYWLTYGFWHSSLILSILGILLSASEITVLHLLGPLEQSSKFSREDYAVRRYQPLLISCKSEALQIYEPRKKMIFTWQGPVMFMSYSVCAFLAGLTILVCTPFIREGRNWGVGHNIATMYLTVLMAGLTTFIFCSYWVYHYVDMDMDVDEEQGNDDEEVGVNLMSLPMGPPPIESHFMPCDMPSRSYSSKPRAI